MKPLGVLPAGQRVFCIAMAADRLFGHCIIVQENKTLLRYVLLLVAQTNAVWMLDLRSDVS